MLPASIAAIRISTASISSAFPGASALTLITPPNPNGWLSPTPMSTSAPGGGVTPFVGAGAGGARVSIANFTDLTVTSAGGLPGLAFGDNVSKWNFAWALHAGLAYRVSPNFTVELAYRYLDMGNGLTGDLRSPDGTNTIVNPTTFKSLTSHDLKMGVRWQLDSPPAEVPPLRRG